MLSALGDQTYLEASKFKSLSKTDFIKLMKDIGLNTSPFKRIHPLLYVEFGMKPDDANHELGFI